ncbi:MAG TPA: hypothetical protein PKA64_12705 [Myxococcota bacterium]|nr:hypothetical protein [Myxococcota bacterium]
MTTIPLLLALFACSAPPAADLDQTSLLPAELAPAPQTFHLAASNFVAGADATLTITGAPPSTTVNLWASSGGLRPGPCPAVLTGACVDITRPFKRLAFAPTTDASGSATVTLSVPAWRTGSYVAIQAAVRSPTPALSNVVGRPIGNVGVVVRTDVDLDGDGYTPAQGDCADFDLSYHPDAWDADFTTRDHNCDDLDRADADRDGFIAATSGGPDCDDHDPARQLDCDPADTDGDGLDDDTEATLGTHPGLVDTDGDGLGDGAEVLVHGTDPLDADTDGDTLSDGAEVATHGTDPLLSDTDGDLLRDDAEVLTHGTDPVAPDTDGDGLTDGDEVIARGTDPLEADTDGGGVDDGVEANAGTDPLDPADDRPVFATGWQITRRVPRTAPWAAHFSPVDGRIWFGERQTTASLFKVVGHTGYTAAASASNVAAVWAAPDGAVFWSEDFDGIIYRYKDGVKTAWVTGFHTGDDDPAGMAIVPPGWTGAGASVGDVIVVDRGNGGPDEVWRFSYTTAEGEVLIRPDHAAFVDPVDVAVSRTAIWIADVADAANGVLFHLDAAMEPIPLVTSLALPTPQGIAVDPISQDLFVHDATLRQVIRVNPTTGASTVLIDNAPSGSWASIDVSTDGSQIVLTATDEILVFTQCDPSELPDSDCDLDGVADRCAIELGRAPDCDGNLVPDACDLASGDAEDCDSNGIPDTCPQCAGLEVVFVMDTSTTMDDEGAALCSVIDAIVTDLEASSVNVEVSLLALDGTPAGIYGCLDADLTHTYGTSLPGNALGLSSFGVCPGGSEVASEDWGRGVGLIAGRHPWTDGAARVIIPLADEGPWCGDPVSDPGNDRTSITYAMLQAVANGVVVSPVMGSGAASTVTSLARELAAATGGSVFTSTNASTQLYDALIGLASQACADQADCDGDGALDVCEVSPPQCP